MAVQARTVDASVTVTLWVPLDASGDLASGVADVLGDVEGVEAADVSAITDVSPRATDIQVTAEAEVTLATVDAEAGADARERLVEGFGVMTVDRLTTEEPAR